MAALSSTPNERKRNYYDAELVSLQVRPSQPTPIISLKLCLGLAERCGASTLFPAWQAPTTRMDQNQGCESCWFSVNPADFPADVNDRVIPEMGVDDTARGGPVKIYMH